MKRTTAFLAAAALLMAAALFIRPGPVLAYEDHGGYSTAVHSRLNLMLQDFPASVFKNLRGQQKQVPFVGFRVNYQVFQFASDEFKDLVLKKLLFDIYKAYGITADDMSNIKLYLDANANGQIDAEDMVVGKTARIIPDEMDIRRWQIAIEDIDLKFTDDVAGNFLLAGDFKKLETGDMFNASLPVDTAHIELNKSSHKFDILQNFGGKVEFAHFVGNRSPRIYSHAAQPFSGKFYYSNYSYFDGTWFDFRIMYSDEDNDPPAKAVLEITDKNGQSAIYPLQEVYYGVKGNKWFGYPLQARVRLYADRQPYSFKFTVSDGSEEVIESFGGQDGPKVRPWIHIISKTLDISPEKTLPGANITVKFYTAKHMDAEFDLEALMGRKHEEFDIISFNNRRERILAGYPELELHYCEMVIAPKKNIDKQDDFVLTLPLRAVKAIKDEKFEIDTQVALYGINYEIVPASVVCRASRGKAGIGDMIIYDITVTMFNEAEFMDKALENLSWPEVSKMTEGTSPKIRANEQLTTYSYTYVLHFFKPPLDGERLVIPETKVDINWQNTIFELKIPETAVGFQPILNKTELSKPPSLELDNDLKGLSADLASPYLGIALGGLISVISLFALALRTVHAIRRVRVIKRSEKKVFKKTRKALVLAMRGAASENSLDHENIRRLYGAIQDFTAALCNWRHNPRSISALHLQKMLTDNICARSHSESWTKILKFMSLSLFEKEKQDKMANEITAELKSLAVRIKKYKLS